MLAFFYSASQMMLTAKQRMHQAGKRSEKLVARLLGQEGDVINMEIYVRTYMYV